MTMSRAHMSLVGLVRIVALAVVVSAAGCASSGDGLPKERDAASADSGGGQCNFCGDSDSCCGGFCVDTTSSDQNCGTCGNTCALPLSNACSNGICSCNFSAACVAGEQCCAGGCSIVESDPQNCGACGVQCGANENCVSNECVCAATGAACAGGTECCSGGCIDTSSDTANCGECGMACESQNSICTTGTCECADACPMDTVLEGCCDDGCKDLCNDQNNCGMCGKVCVEDCDFGICGEDGGFPNFECIGFPPP